MIENGIFNINKPAGMTSHDVVYRVRRLTGIKKVGHGGTLDPMATGVLPVFVGNATRVIEYLETDTKKYRCTMTLGMTTDTQDVWGTVLEERPVSGISRQKVEEALNGFRGPIKQTPPMYSAVRVKGKRLYEYARAGQTVEVKARDVYIKEIALEGFDEARGEAVFTVECSKGTYVRTICAEAGEKLGCGAVMSALERTAAGAFKIEDAVSLDDLTAMDTERAESLMLPTDFPLGGLGKAVTGPSGARAFVNGNDIPYGKFCMETPPSGGRPGENAYRVYCAACGGLSGGAEDFHTASGEELFLGIAFFDEETKCLKPDKVLCRGDAIDRI